MLGGSPLIWLAVSGWLAVAGTWGFKEFQAGRAWKAAYAEGKAAGLGSASSAGTESANQTVTIIRDAEEATPLVAGDTAIRALCKTRASCRERGQIK